MIYKLFLQNWIMNEIYRLTDKDELDKLELEMHQLSDEKKINDSIEIVEDLIKPIVLE